jgi:hypothetical protein
MAEYPWNITAVQSFLTLSSNFTAACCSRASLQRVRRTQQALDWRTSHRAADPICCAASMHNHQNQRDESCRTHKILKFSLRMPFARDAGDCFSPPMTNDRPLDDRTRAHVAFYPNQNGLSWDDQRTGKGDFRFPQRARYAREPAIPGSSNLT